MLIDKVIPLATIQIVSDIHLVAFRAVFIISDAEVIFLNIIYFRN